MKAVYSQQKDENTNLVKRVFRLGCFVTGHPNPRHQTLTICLSLNPEIPRQAEECVWPRRMGLGHASAEYCSDLSVVEKPGVGKKGGVEAQKVVKASFGLRLAGGGVGKRR
jgi:hypothetical protein